MSKYGNRKRTDIELLNEFNKVHNFKYTYKTPLNYKSGRDYIDIKCNIHSWFRLTSEYHLSGRGCPKCVSSKKKKINFIKKCIFKYGLKYEYRFINYIDSRIHVKIKCKKHGIFKIMPEVFLKKNLKTEPCPLCELERRQKLFVIKANRVHNYKYNYSKLNYVNPFTNIEILCPKHGSFWQSPHNHLSGNGCKYCSIDQKISKGEKKIKEYLESRNVLYMQEYIFKDLKKYRFDFYLPNHNTCIEYDGELHFKSVDFFGGDKTLENTQQRDSIKNNYCRDNNIKILRIPYWNFKSIEIILENYLK